MKKYLIILLLGVISNISAQNIETLLFELPDVSFHKVDNAEDSIYELRVKQPLDHLDLSKGYFLQRVFLKHVGYNNPTVIITQGYSADRLHPNELTELIGGNQIEVEHRYFGESIPDSLDYTYLNLEQASADLHHINELFKTIYKGKWLSTGISKGGATTIFYRYFYPYDVDVSVPYVAPINREFEEQRIYDFLNTKGSDECRKKIYDLQRRLLSSKEEVLPLFRMYSNGAKLNFTYLTFEQAFEYTILEYPFSFWQYGHDCNDIPTNETPLFEAVEYFMSVSDIVFFADRSMEYMAPHYYQSAQQMGYYGYETNLFKDLLTELPKNPHAAFVPSKIPVKFDGALLQKINKWLPKNKEEFIYINGALDTWSATAVPSNYGTSSLYFFIEGKNHGNARIRNMGLKDQAELIYTLEKWLEIDIKNNLNKVD